MSCKGADLVEIASGTTIQGGHRQNKGSTASTGDSIRGHGLYV